jgi:hypothetical protein
MRNILIAAMLAGTLGLVGTSPTLSAPLTGLTVDSSDLVQVQGGYEYGPDRGYRDQYRGYEQYGGRRCRIRVRCFRGSYSGGYGRCQRFRACNSGYSDYSPY